MGKKSLGTPRGRVKQVLRQLSLRSRERAAALRRDGYACQVCHAKQSKARGREVAGEVHHIAGVQWEKLIDLVYEMLLCAPDQMITLCRECHEKETLPKIQHNEAPGARVKPTWANGESQ